MKHFSFRWILSEKFNVWISGSLPRDGWLEGNWYFHSSSLWVSLGPNMNLKRGDQKVEIPLLSIKQRPSPRLWMNGKLIPKPVYRVRRATRRYGQRGSGIKKYRRNTKCLIKQILEKMEEIQHNVWNKYCKKYNIIQGYSLIWRGSRNMEIPNVQTNVEVWKHNMKLQR